MKNLLKVTCAVLLMTGYFGCSEMLQKTDGFGSLPKNSLIVLDQMSKAVRALETVKNTNILLDTLPTTTPNDIKIQGDFAYVVLSSPLGSPSEGNKLIRYDLLNGGSSVLAFPSGSNPYFQAVDGNRIYVTLSISNQVAVIDMAGFSIVQTVTLTPAGMPYGIAADSNNIYVSTSDGYSGNNSRITVISKSNFTQVTNIPCIKNPMSLTVVNGKLYIAGVSDYDGTGKVQSMDLTSYTVTDLAGFPNCAPSYIKSFNNKLFVIDGQYGGTGGLYIYDLSTSAMNYVLSNANLQGMDFNGTALYTSEGFAGTKTYQVNLADLSVQTINGIGGGDCALYQ